MGKFFSFSSYFTNNYYLQNAQLLRERGGLMAWTSRRVVHASRALVSFFSCLFFTLLYLSQSPTYTEAHDASRHEPPVIQVFGTYYFGEQCEWEEAAASDECGREIDCWRSGVEQLTMWGIGKPVLKVFRFPPVLRQQLLFIVSIVQLY